jgi:hypothetical protein
MIRKQLMVLFLLLFALAGCTTLSLIEGDAKFEETETQGVIVEGTPSLTLSHFAGVVHVRNGESGRISADLTKKSRLSDESEAQAQLDQIVMSFTQNGTDVTLNIEEPTGTAQLASGPTADLELQVPHGTSLNLNLGAGEITVDQPAGDVVVDSGAGETTVILPATASFRLVVEGGATGVSSEFEGVPDGGVAVDIDTTIGANPTQTLTFNVGAGQVNLQRAP